MPDLLLTQGFPGDPFYVGSAFKIFEVYLHSAVYYKSLEPNEEYQEFLHNSAY